jgi:site-specific recombinase XerD
MRSIVHSSPPQIMRHVQQGPLGVHIEHFAARLRKEGHCQQSTWRNLRVVRDFSDWLARKQIALVDLDERTVDQYLRFRRRYRHPYLSDHRALVRLLAVLREIDAIAPMRPTILDPLGQVQEDFNRYLLVERGLRPVSATRHVPVVRQFLSEQCPGGRQSISRLTAADITEYIGHHAKDHSPRSAQIMCWTLRAFMRYLQYRGHIVADLASSVPAVKTWRFASLPKYLPPQQVHEVLDSCDRHSPIGRRDYAILLLLSRIGLRANEVALLTLDDIDWRSGQLTVQGKGGLCAQMPLPVEVGTAIADYLQHGRPPSDSRRVFLRDLAPHSGFASSAGISVVAKTALTRAGIDGVPHKGAHLFRHSLATQLLRAGASLTEIGQVLRHQHHDSTRIYAKVDITALRTLGLPWPGGAQ